jgi:hypothetical protein
VDITAKDVRHKSRLKEGIRLIDEILSFVPTKEQMPPSVRHEVGYYFIGSSQEINCIKDETGKIVSRTTNIKQATLPLKGVPIKWKAITELRQNLAICLGQCGIEYPDSCNLAEERQGNQTLVFEVPWRLCMNGLRSRLQWELKEAEAQITTDSLPATAEADAEGTAKPVEQLEHQKILLPTNPEIAEVHNAIQKADPATLNVSEICRSIAKKRGINAESLRVSYNRWKKNNLG